MDNKKIGMFIVERRKTQALTQQDLADKLYVTVQAVSKWECGKSLPDVSIMQPLCKILGISINDLLNGELIPQDNREAEAEKQIYNLLLDRKHIAKTVLCAVPILIAVSLFFFAIIVVATFLLIPSDVASWRIIVLLVIVGVVSAGSHELESFIEKKMITDKLKKN